MTENEQQTIPAEKRLRPVAVAAGQVRAAGA